MESQWNPVAEKWVASWGIVGGHPAQYIRSRECDCGRRKRYV
jgi:hypothetical protein